MPKSAKKRKDKAADFSKARLKLGKGKQPSANVIDTSFKARSIVLPSQSIAIEKDLSQPTTKRQLTFADLLSHLKHHNSGTRKDAILGLRELLESHWDLLRSSLTSLINALVRIIADEDASVRKSLLAFLSWLLPRVPSEDLIPHSSLLLLFATSAQTHIFPEIRVDAVRFLDIFLECIPEAVTAGWCENQIGHGSRVLGGYLGILNAGIKYGETDGPLKATSTASVVLTPTSKLVILRSLSTFLRLALSPLAHNYGSHEGNTAHPLNPWFMRNTFSSPEAFSAFEGLLTTTSQADGKDKGLSRTWQAFVEPDDENDDSFPQRYLLTENPVEAWTLQELQDLTSALEAPGAKDNAQVASQEFLAHLASTLHSTIIETYLDCAPSVFSPSSTPSETEVQLVVTIALIVRTLYLVVLQPSVDNVHIEHLESIINYMSPYFPAFQKHNKFDRAYEEFNLIFCEISSILVNASRNCPPRSTKNGKQTTKRAPFKKFSIQIDRVAQYIIRRLRGEANSTQNSSMLTASPYLSLLPTIWAIINKPGLNQQEADEIIHATLDHALKVSSKSACKPLTVEFVARLFLLDSEPCYQGEFKGGNDPAVKEKFDAWLLHLPQVLWELGDSNLPATEMILLVLLRILQRQSKSLPQTELMRSLQLRLVPYFYIDHPNRGPLPGPFRKLPSSRLRVLALDVTAAILLPKKSEDASYDGLLQAISLAVAGEVEEAYWSHVSTHSRLSK
ncbi:hypothetical protein BYT27DRAFT_7165165 [Phlegmacium glaucopus]|nr:hypothetical protein BYT27DRAFT_7165165 [Phlegmacium glaucopus]